MRMRLYDELFRAQGGVYLDAAEETRLADGWTGRGGSALLGRARFGPGPAAFGPAHRMLARSPAHVKQGATSQAPRHEPGHRQNCRSVHGEPTMETAIDEEANRCTR